MASMSSIGIDTLLAQLRKRKLYDEILPRQQELATHVESAPDPADYRLSTGHKILGGVLAGLTGATSGAPAAIKFAEDTRERPYRSAVERHVMKGKGLEELADNEAEMVERQRRENLARDQLALQAQDRAFNEKKFTEESARRREESERDAMFKDTEMEFSRMREERAGKQLDETSRHNKAMEGVARTRANRPSSSFNPNRPVIQPYIRKAMQDVVNDMAAESPRYMKFVLRDKNGYIVGVDAAAAQKDPEGFNIFKQERDRRTRKRLNTPVFDDSFEDEDDELSFEP